MHKHISPQIAIEYYLDENNNVQKRNAEQLKELLKDTNSPQKNEYINFLIGKYEQRIAKK